MRTAAIILSKVQLLAQDTALTALAATPVRSRWVPAATQLTAPRTDSTLYNVLALRL